ncbi:acyltransferase family protein [Pontibacter harenae]|uniref:acyltransferase family protein n=1 Tax=Pontibacter harenae TaxID=2894083 RepID=UPI001E5D1196|nr:acyltransferase [Pontibacter harenae]MCC9166549.1 acyltransferase [Pontibacter harenae]
MIPLTKAPLRREERPSVSHRITKLDGIRGIFSLIIILAHLPEQHLPFNWHSSFIVRESSILVDFFFVLSGFVITYNYQAFASTSGFKVYLKKRFVRLYPLLFYTTTVFLLFKLAFNLYLPHLVNLNEPTSALLLQYLDTILFLNSTPLLGATLAMNGPSWSISAEMIVYVLYGLVLLYSVTKPRTKTKLMLTLLGLSVLFCLYKGEYFFGGDYGFIRALLAFIIGYLVFLLSKYTFRLPSFLEIFIPINILAICYMLNISHGTTKEMIGLGVVPLFFGLSILLLLKSDGYVSKLLETKPFQFLGDISYSVYLNHNLMIILIPRFFFTFLKLEINNLTQSLVLLTTVGALILYSYLTWVVIEKKLGKYLKQKMIKEQPK